MSRIERALIMLALLALGAGLVFSEAARRRDEKRAGTANAVMSAELADARAKADAALSAVIPPNVIKYAEASVYLIVVDGAPRATAFVVDRAHGILATAAHSAVSLPLDDPHADIHIINRQGGRALRVTGRTLHGGFGAFRDLVADYAPIRKNSSIYDPLAAPIRDLAFDAAFITVDPIDPATGANLLGPDLKIAPEASLIALGPGDPIAVIGYPYDTLNDGVQAESAEPRAERGAISAMIAPIDAAAEPIDPTLANLIIHRMATAGGDSGAPIIDAKGEVIGIHTHGVVTPSSNGDGAGQRAEVIYDLQSKEREKDRMETIFLPGWTQRLGYFARAEEALPWSFYMEYAHPGQKPGPKVGDIDYGAKPPFEKKMSKLTFSAPTAKMNVAAPDAADGSGAPGAFAIDESGEFAEKWFSVEPGREAVIFAYDYSLRSRMGACRLAAYWRKKGETRLRAERARASVELHLRGDAASPGDYQVIIRRDADCDPTRSAFFAGEISWPAAPVVATLEGNDAREQNGALGEGAGAFFHAARVSAQKFFDCTFDKAAHRALCEKPTFIDMQTASE